MRLKATLLALVSLTAFVVNRPALAQQTSNKAVSEALRAARKYAEADNLKAVIERCDKALALESKCSEAYSLRGWARRLTGDPVGALSDYERVIQLDPNNVQGYLDRASVNIDQDQHQQAFKDLDTALKLNPKCANVYLERSRYWFIAANSEMAIKEATTAISLDKTNSYSYYWRACCQSKNKKYRAALSDINQAIKYEPKDSSYYLTRADLKTKLGDMTGAITDCSMAIKVNPKDAAAYDRRGYLRLNSYDRNGAVKDFEAGLAIAPDDLGCNFALGCEMLRSGHFAEAISKFDVVARLRPSTYIYYLRGRCKMKLLRWSEAITDCNAALALDNSDAFSYFLRAECKTQLGDTPGTVSDYLIGTSKDPSLGAMHLSSCLKRIWSRFTSSIHNFHQASGSDIFKS